MLFIMTISARHGMRTAMLAMLGCMTALLAMMSISAAGLGALLQTFPAVFEALRLAGAAYLAYLGVKCWRSPVQDQPTRENGGAPPAAVAAAQSGAVYRQAFLVAASNPKAILFAAAFFPQLGHACIQPADWWRLCWLCRLDGYGARLREAWRSSSISKSASGTGRLNRYPW